MPDTLIGVNRNRGCHQNRECEDCSFFGLSGAFAFNVGRDLTLAVTGKV